MTGMMLISQYRPTDKTPTHRWFSALMFSLGLALPGISLAASHDEVTIRMMTMDESSTENVTRMIQLPEIYVNRPQKPEGKFAAKNSTESESGAEETSQNGDNQNNPMDQGMEQIRFQQPQNEIQPESPSEFVHEMEQQQEQLQNEIRTEQDDHTPVNQPQEPGQNGPGPDRPGSAG